MSILGNIYWQLDAIKDKLSAEDQALVAPLMDEVRTAYLRELERDAAGRGELALATPSEAHRLFDEISGEKFRVELVYVPHWDKRKRQFVASADDYYGKQVGIATGSRPEDALRSLLCELGKMWAPES